MISEKAKAFRITEGKGFGITFPNGYCVSVQWGPGNYCDNYSHRPLDDTKDCGETGSNTAECAVFNAAGDMLILPSHNDMVTNRSTPAEVLELMNWLRLNQHPNHPPSRIARREK